jgi:mono/diheme cytochrome c family protein
MRAAVRLAAGLAAGLAVLLAAGCEKAMQDMYRQPRYDPLEPSGLFPNGLSSRTPPAGTLAARTGGLAESTGGLRGAEVPAPQARGTVYPVLESAQAGADGKAGAVTAPPDLPIEVTAATYRRGRERFEIFCAPCHSVVGDGDGMVVRRGFPAPPSYHTDRLRRAPDRHFYDVITHGYGAMYPYADRLSPEDRWAVVAYIRALQLSQHAPASVLNEHDRAQLGDGRG